MVNIINLVATINNFDKDNLIVRNIFIIYNIIFRENISIESYTLFILLVYIINFTDKCTSIIFIWLNLIIINNIN